MWQKQSVRGAKVIKRNQLKCSSSWRVVLTDDVFLDTFDDSTALVFTASSKNIWNMWRVRWLAPNNPPPPIRPRGRQLTEWIPQRGGPGNSSCRRECPSARTQWKHRSQPLSLQWAGQASQSPHVRVYVAPTLPTHQNEDEEIWRSNSPDSFNMDSVASCPQTLSANEKAAG